MGGTRPCRICTRGFTLVELLVAITVMALMAAIGWRGIDSMTGAQASIGAHSDELLTLQTGLAQWRFDLDALSESRSLSSLDWDGRALRLTRQAPQGSDGLVVVAWTRRANGQGQWLRWQSAILRSREDWASAWTTASTWAQNGTTSGTAQEGGAAVAVFALADWQLFYFRNNAWTNPLSSAEYVPHNDAPAPGASPAGVTAALTPVYSAASATPTSTNTAGSEKAGPQSLPEIALPDGIRLVLTLPGNQPITGKLTLDWAGSHARSISS